MSYDGYTVGDMMNDCGCWLREASFIDRFTVYVSVAYCFGVVLLCLI